MRPPPCHQRNETPPPPWHPPMPRIFFQRVGGSHGDPPYPHLQPRLPPSFFLTPDQFLETFRRQQGGTPHSWTRVGTPTPSDQVTSLTPTKGS